MPSNQDPWWLREDLEIIGFQDGEEDEKSEDEPEDEPESDEETSDDEGEEEGEEDTEESDEEQKSKTPKSEKENIEGLKSALRKERMNRKRLEKEVARLTPPEDKGDKGDSGDKSSEADAERSRRERLLSRKLLDSAVDNLIIRHAVNFRNSDEVLKLVNRSEIETDQDDNDPSEIDIDEESVIDAVRALAKKSPHLLKSEDGNKPRSGSTFSRSRRKGSEPSDEELRKKYSALRRS